MIAFLVFFMRQMQKTPGRDFVAQQMLRKEERLAARSRIFYVLSSSEKDLSEEEIISTLGDARRLQSDSEKARFREALYEMISEGTAELTEEKKYRVKTR